MDKDIFSYIKGEVSAFYVLLGYMEAELDRINRVKALPENSLERMIPVGKKKDGSPLTYGETGSKFTIFDDILRPELKEELMNIPKEYGASLRDYLKLPESGDLRQRLFNDVIKDELDEYKTSEKRKVQTLDDVYKEEIFEELSKKYSHWKLEELLKSNNIL
jgi:hypothetical protein